MRRFGAVAVCIQLPAIVQRYRSRASIYRSRTRTEFYLPFSVSNKQAEDGDRGGGFFSCSLNGTANELEEPVKAT
jgi:hypothetical protein